MRVELEELDVLLLLELEEAELSENELNVVWVLSEYVLEECTR